MSTNCDWGDALVIKNGGLVGVIRWEGLPQSMRSGSQAKRAVVRGEELLASHEACRGGTSED